MGRKLGWVNHILVRLWRVQTRNRHARQKTYLRIFYLPNHSLACGLAWPFQQDQNPSSPMPQHGASERPQHCCPHPNNSLCSAVSFSLTLKYLDFKTLLWVSLTSSRKERRWERLAKIYTQCCFPWSSAASLLSDLQKPGSVSFFLSVFQLNPIMWEQSY